LEKITATCYAFLLRHDRSAVEKGGAKAEWTREIRWPALGTEM
jgi:hypothetical protein